MWRSRKRHNKGCPGGGFWRCKCGDFGIGELMVALANLAIAGAAGYGIEQGISALMKSKKTDMPGLPALPSLDTSEQAAKDAQTAQRRVALAAGGSTNITGGSGIILGSDIQSVSLVGG